MTHQLVCLLHGIGGLESYIIKIKRCLKLLEIPQEIEDQKDTKDDDWPQNGEIVFDDVKLRYRPKTDLVLQGLSFKIQAGHKIGVVGRTGAGKSTMSLALTRIIETESGKIMIDGQDISTISLSQVRSKITIIPQDPSIFKGTVRYNVDPDNRYSDEEILELLKRAELENLVNKNNEKEKE